MLKTLKDFTPEIQKKIPEYIKKATEDIYNGNYYNNFDIEKAKEAVYCNYELCGYKKPIVLITENPLEQQYLFNYLKLNIKKYEKILYVLNNEFIEIEINNIKCKISSYFILFYDLNYLKKINLKLDSQLDNQLYNQLRSQLDNQLNSQLRSQLNSQLRSQLDNQLDNQLDSQLRSQLDNQLNSQLRSQLNSQLDSQLDNQLNSQLDSQLYNQLRSQLRNQLNSQLRSQLYNQLDSQLRSQLDNQLNSQLRSQLNSQLDSQLDSQLNNELYNQLRSQLDNQLNSQLRSQLNSQLDSQLNNELYNQLRSQLDSQLDNQLNSQLRSQLDNQLNSQLDSQLRSQLDSQLYNQLDSQIDSDVSLKKISTYNNNYLFTLNIYSNVYYTWFEFIRKEFNIELSINDKFQKIFRLQRESGIYSCIFSESVAVISKYPVKINQEQSGLFRLNSTEESAIMWSNNFAPLDCYYLNGLNINKELFDKLTNKNYTFEEWVNEPNEEIKSAVISFYEQKFGNDYVVDFFKDYLKEIDTYVDKKKDKYLVDTVGMNVGVYTLFKGKVLDEEIAYVRVYCPSTDRCMFLGVNPNNKNAKDSVASLCQVPKELVNDLTEIRRVGEIFNFTFNQKGTDLIKKGDINLNNTVSLKGDTYFKLMTYEY